MLKRIFIYLIILIGIGLAMYPWISNYLYEKSADSQVITYQEKTDSMKDEDLEEMLKQAEEYNRILSQSQVELTDPFVADQEALDEKLEYKSLLNIDNSGMIGYIEIPAISVNLPIFHGTQASTLEKGIGHLEGSSLPVGGNSTHSILTGHTGLNSAKLFTDLTELSENDLFFIYVAGRNLAYKVCEINVVKPEDISKLMIQSGRDLVTLVTCTPYGVNTHRLLVTGERTDYNEDVKDQAEKQAKNTDSQWMRTYRNAIIVSLIIAFVILFLLNLFQKRRRKKK